MKLKLHPTKLFNKPEGPVVLIVMDGVGIGPEDDSNAVHLAHTPFLDQLYATHPYIELKAHGTAVGMPTDDDMGNSEVGHNALGAGRIFAQGASLVETAIQSGTLFEGDTWKESLANAKTHNSTLHFITLLSDGNVHSHIRHLLILLDKAAEASLQTIRIHTLLDGRDVDQKSALNYLDILQEKMDALTANGIDIKIASGGGRMVTTMDRYNADWRIVERGWKAHVLGDARHFTSAQEAVSTYYKEDPEITDQYLPSFVIAKNGAPVGTIEDNDSVILTNFRGDRAIELTQAFESETLDYFDRKRVPKVHFSGIMQYDGDLNLPSNFLVPPPQIEHPISAYFCAESLKSFAISETQKYGHVTYFWNGNKSGYINEGLETYIEIPSDTIPFDQKPEMKAVEITDKAIELLNTKEFDTARINYPNGDMVGHTGVMDAVIKSVEITDKSVQRIVETVNKLNGITVILADHGNADEMFTVKKGIKTPKTAHTLNPVPCVIVDTNNQNNYTMNTKLDTPGLANIASTVCNLLGYEKPEDYEASLVKPLNT